MNNMRSEKVNAFIARWSASGAAERANKDMFFVELCDLLGVERPDPSSEARPEYCFEKPVVIAHEDGRSTTRFIDFYKKHFFVIEAKQGSESGDATVGTARRGTASWDKAMRGAFGQALKYASYLPEGKPPFLITCDIGHCFEIWTGFSGDYGGYGARRTVELSALADPEVFGYFAKIFTDPLDLDPARHAQRITREVAAKLAELARTLEAGEHHPELVAQFLMRAIFTMFCEDVGLLPENLFTDAIRKHWIPDPRTFQAGVEQLWRAMKDGLPFGFVGKLLHFNGGLFSTWQSLPMTPKQLELLLEAAKMDWASVEPAIFGTLVERALDPVERRKLGAHFTPREYIERLVRPTVIEPLRAEWEIAQAEARQIMDKSLAGRVALDKPGTEEGGAEPTPADKKKAAAVIRRFHDHLVHTRVLDPACGSGNFLYVTLDLFKEIEAEALRELSDLGETQALLEMEGFTVNPGQFLGIEINPRAREIADLVLWIGYLQWHRRTHGDRTPAEPVLRPFKNIVCRDAVLEYDDIKPRLDKDGKPVTVWDMRTYKQSPVTGKEVPDEDARLPVLDYVNPRPAEWPEADYVVSNPPFIGDKKLRATLGDSYVKILRNIYPSINQSADYVMYWWDHAANLVADEKLVRFGMITTNSIVQPFNRKVVASHLTSNKKLSIVFAIADHPWVDSGAAVRISMTAVEKGEIKGKLKKMTSFRSNDCISGLKEKENLIGIINESLTVGVDTKSINLLLANQGIAHVGVALHAKGLSLNLNEAEILHKKATHFGIKNIDELIKLSVNGRDLIHNKRSSYVLDLYGIKEGKLKSLGPIYQWVLENVYPDRAKNRRASYRKFWWICGEPRVEMRRSLLDLDKYIVTPLTSSRRFFVFLENEILPDQGLVVIASNDSFILGVLSSLFHSKWSLSAGGTLEDRPRYNKSLCFDPFPFPDASEDQKAQIRELGERLDAHRKRVQADYPDATLTAMYNALERLREIYGKSGEEIQPLTEKERTFHEKALIGILKQIHDDLDNALADAYGWPADLPDQEILERLVALNHERAAEEKQGIIRWLRPDFQDPEGKHRAAQGEFADMRADSGAAHSEIAASHSPTAWPKSVPDQLRAIRDLLSTRPGSWTVNDVAASFKRAHKATIEKHLESMEALGILHGEDFQGRIIWTVL